MRNNDKLKRIGHSYVGFVLIVALLVVPLGACGPSAAQKEDLARYASTTVMALRDVVPILRANSFPTTRLENGIRIGDRLVSALKSDGPAIPTDALTLTGQMIDAFEEIVTETELIRDSRVKTIVLVGLAVGHVALHHLASLVDKAVAVVETRALRVPGVTGFQSSTAETKAEAAKAKIKAFKKKKKQWRCKSAVTGRFVKMEMCKTNPETTYVVTFYR